jgi:hypothetical protein
MTASIRLPELNCPFGSEVSSYADEVDEHVLDWARRFALLTEPADIDRFRRAKVGRLAARTSPGSGKPLLDLLADWQMWLFVFDDRYCDESETGAHPERLSRIITSFVCVLDGPSGGARRTDPLTMALADITGRLAAVATAPQMFRFRSAVRGYFLAQFWEAGHRADDGPAGLAEYQIMRRHSGAVPTCVALIDVAGGFELPAGEFCRRDVLALTDIAVDVTCWANDIVSYQKEAARSLKVHSLPAVLARERGVTAPQAIKVAASMHDSRVASYLAAEPALRGGASPQLARYLDGLRNWMGGNLRWSLETGRYGQATSR